MIAPKERFGRAVPDLVAPPLVLLSPFVNFLKINDYGLLRPESLICMAGIAGVGLVPGLVMALGGRFVRALIMALLVPLFIDLYLDWFGLDAKNRADGVAVLVLASLIGGFAVAWLVGAHITRIVAAASATVLVATVFWPAPGGRAEVAAPAAEQSGNPDLPPVLHLILDEQLATEGIPVQIAGGRELKERLIRFYPSWGFRLFGRTYSRYFETHNSIPNLINFTVQPIDAFYLQSLVVPLVVKENAYFRKMLDEGYKIHVYQSEFMDFCRASGLEVASCFTYRASSIKIFEGVDISAGQKARAMLGQFVLLSPVHNLVRAAYRVLRYRLAGADFAQLPPWTLETMFLPPVESLSLLERLGADIVAAGRGRMYFVHLLLPHYRYAYDADCELRPRVAGWGVRFNRLAFMPYVNTPETRTQTYALYVEQVACLHKRLGVLFERMRAAGLYDEAIIFVHGDHGSRIGLVDPSAKNKKLLSRDDYIDHFSTLFAVKAPWIEPGYDLGLRPVQELFAEILLHGLGAEGLTPVVEPQVWLRRDPFGPMERQPMVPFGAARRTDETGGVDHRPVFPF